MSEGKGPGEGGNPVERTGHDPADYTSPVAQRERSDKAKGNPDENIIEQQRIRREEAEYERG